MYKNPEDQKACVLKWKKEHPDRKKFLNKRWIANHPSYINFQSMKARTTNPSHTHYPNYGGRGIKVSPEWQTFARFEREFGYSKPGPKYTIDRIDNDGNYEPGNVQWLTGVENNQKRYAITRA